MDLGPVKEPDFIRLGFFPSKSTACRRLNKLRRRRRAREIGKLHLDALYDHAHVYWCNRPLKFDNREHEAYVMEVVLAYWPSPARTGYDVDPDIRPDATIEIGGELYHVELDTGSMSRAQVQARMKLYEGCKDTVLVVSLSAARMERMRQWCGLGEVGFFSTIQQVVRDPYGDVWLDHAGGRAGINRPANTAVNEGANGAAAGLATR